MIAMELNMHGNPLIIASVYIPHENTNDERTRQRAWEDLTDFVTETSEAINTILIGDLNTNIHAKKEEEDGHIGPHVYGRGMDFLRNKEHNTPANKTTNREYLANHLWGMDMKVANTYYQKPHKVKGTYQRKCNVNGGPPWNTDRYCKLDHIMVKKQWMNSITNVQADPYTNINTDHKVLEIKIRQKLKARTQPNREPTLKGIKPEKDGKTREEAIGEYNSKFRELVEEEWEIEGMQIGQPYKLTKEAARNAFNKPRTWGKRQDCDARLRRIINDWKMQL